MKTYISLLRGINVSGQKKIKMADLKAIYEGMDFKEVKTYIQSGNVIFNTASKDDNQIIEKIQNKIFENYNFKVPVLLRSVEELKLIIKTNPFLADMEEDINKYYITFLAHEPEKENLDKINAASLLPEKFIIKGKEIYLHVPMGYGNAKLSNNFFESKLKVDATTRNWRTVNELVKISES